MDEALPSKDLLPPPHIHFGSVFEGYGVLCLFCGKELAP